MKVVRTQPQHAEGLARLQTIVFPTLADDQRFKAQHYLHHIQIFPEGQFCVTDGERVVGMTSTIRYDFDFAHPEHTFAEMIAGGWLSTHQPAGRWLYGMDIGVDPEYRGRGIARALYDARQDVVRELGLEGQVTVGMPSGYGAVRDRISAADYYNELVAGKRTDPTISVQMHLGFAPRGLIAGYIDDPVCDGYGIVLVRKP